MRALMSARRERRRFSLTIADLGMTTALLLATVSSGLSIAMVSSFLWLATIASLGLALAASLLRRRREEVEAAWREALFEPPGISLRRQDWTTAGEAILKLRRDGVHDIEA